MTDPPLPLVASGSAPGSSMATNSSSVTYSGIDAPAHEELAEAVSLGLHGDARAPFGVALAEQVDRVARYRPRPARVLAHPCLLEPVREVDQRPCSPLRRIA